MYSWLTLLAVVFALGLFAVLLSWAIMRNLREGERFRARLANRLEQLRLHRLMRMLGMDPNRYLHEQPIVDAERHMRTCARCPESARCDQALEQEQPESVAPYCANYEDLQALRDREKQE
jgi:type II secretory pathway component PulJ